MGRTVTEYDEALAEEMFYRWWGKILELYSPEARTRFEADVNYNISIEELVKFAYSNGVKHGLILAEKSSA